MTIDEFSKQLIEKALVELGEKSKCNHSGAGSSCSIHGDADCNSSKQNRAEAKNAEGKEQGVDGKACWDGYKQAGTKKKGGKTVDNCVKAEEVDTEKEGHEDEAEDKKLIKKEVKKALKKEAKDMPGSQEKIDANKNGKVDAHDFALLRGKKGKKTVKEMWQLAEAAKITKKKFEIEIMPDVDTPNDPEPPTGKKAKLKKEEKDGASKESEQKFHNKIDKLVHKTFGKRPEEKKMKEEVELEEKKLSKAEAEKKEKFVKGMKKKFGTMKSKYGDKAQSVMYGSATNMAKK